MWFMVMCCGIHADVVWFIAEIFIHYFSGIGAIDFTDFETDYSFQKIVICMYEDMVVFEATLMCNAFKTPLLIIHRNIEIKLIESLVLCEDSRNHALLKI